MSDLPYMLYATVLTRTYYIQLSNLLRNALITQQSTDC